MSPLRPQPNKRLRLSRDAARPQENSCNGQVSEQQLTYAPTSPPPTALSVVQGLFEPCIGDQSELTPIRIDQHPYLSDAFVLHARSGLIICQLCQPAVHVRRGNHYGEHLRRKHSDLWPNPGMKNLPGEKLVNQACNAALNMLASDHTPLDSKKIHVRIPLLPVFEGFTASEYLALGCYFSASNKDVVSKHA